MHWPAEKVSFCRIIEVSATICAPTIPVGIAPYAQCNYGIADPHQSFQKETDINFEAVAEFFRIMKEFRAQY